MSEIPLTDALYHYVKDTIAVKPVDTWTKLPLTIERLLHTAINARLSEPDQCRSGEPWPKKIVDRYTESGQVTLFLDQAPEDWLMALDHLGDMLKAKMRSQIANKPIWFDTALITHSFGSTDNTLAIRGVIGFVDEDDAEPVEVDDSMDVEEEEEEEDEENEDPDDSSYAPSGDEDESFDPEDEDLYHV
jgi:hypothetical protein